MDIPSGTRQCESEREIREALGRNLIVVSVCILREYDHVCGRGIHIYMGDSASVEFISENFPQWKIISQGGISMACVIGNMSVKAILQTIKAKIKEARKSEDESDSTQTTKG